MDEKRINIAQKNVANYLEQGLLKKEKFEQIIYNTYINNAHESLGVANHLFEDKISSLWVVVSSYYAMFYMACAYLYTKGYKASHEIAHQVIYEALIVHAKHDVEKHFLEAYAEEQEKALAACETFLDSYEQEKIKRARFQYETTEAIKEAKAKTSLERAKNFVAVMRQVIKV